MPTTRGSRSTAAKPAAASAAAPPPAPALPPTLGPVVCRFMERYLVHGPGDVLGKPFLLMPVQRAIVYTAYELQPNGHRLWRHMLACMPKGNAKSELAAALAIAEAVGPVIFAGWKSAGRPIGKERTSPEIPVAAASFDQADNVFECVREMIRNGPLANFFEVFDTEVLLKDRPGKIERVAAVAGANDGGKPTFSVHDELHEWTGNKERVHLVLMNNLQKRADTWALDISTAPDSEDGLMGRERLRAQRIARKEEPALGFRMIWLEADRTLDLDKPEELERAIRQANPGVEAGFLSLEALMARYYQLRAEGKTHEFRRYHLGQITASPTEWLPEGVWVGRADPHRTVPEQAPIALAVDGDWDGRRIGIVGCTVDRPRHLFVTKAWQKGETDPATWTPPKLGELVEELRRCCAHWQVREIALNATRFPELFAELEGDLPIVAWPTHTTARMAPACKQLRDSLVVNQDVTHDGSAAFQKQVESCHVQSDSHERQWISHAPLAVAAVVAYDMSIRTPDPEPESVYETRGLLEL